VSDSLWKRRFGSDPGLLGKTIRLNGNPYLVVGIMPPEFHWGRAYGQNARAEIWAPFALTPARIAPDQRGNEFLDLYGRVRPATALAAAQSQVDLLFERFRRDYPVYFPRGSGLVTRLIPLQREIVGDARGPLWIVFGAVALVLLIACTNVAGLLLARAAGRRAEMAIRVSLGASRLHLVRQLFAESAVLATLAGAAGLAAATTLLRLIERHAPADFPLLQKLTLDARAILFIVGVSALTAIAFGLIPAFGAIRDDLRPSIEEGRSVSGRARGRLRRVLVAAQLGLATLLLVGAGLLVVSLTTLLRVDPGFEPRHVITAELSLPPSRYPDPARRNAFRQATIERLRALPGVRETGAVSILPMGGNMNTGTFHVEGRPDEPGGTQPHAEIWAATPGYFPALKIDLLHGRLFTPADQAGSLPVVIVDDVLARAYWGTENPIGKRLDFESDPQSPPLWRVIVGVVRNIKARTLDDEPRPAYYVPFSQSYEPIVTFVARVEGKPEAYANAIRAAVAATDSEQPVGTIAPLTELLSESVSRRRLATTLLSAFAASALLLAAVGLYGVLAYSVTQRRREIGIRIALGAPPGRIARLVLRESGWMIAAGIAAGLVAAALLTRILSGLLYGVAPLDPATFLAVSTVLAGVSLLASYLPARRAAAIDPMEALRYE
jgi:putative ABC transport system permease protein